MDVWSVASISKFDASSDISVIPHQLSPEVRWRWLDRESGLFLVISAWQLAKVSGQSFQEAVEKKDSSEKEDESLGKCE